MKNLLFFFVVIGALLSSACSQTPFYHQHIMRGQVVSANSEQVQVCVGEKDGAKVDDVLSVYRIIVSGQDVSGIDIYDKEVVGKVKISRLTGEHFAIARVVEGTISKHDIVELSR